MNTREMLRSANHRRGLALGIAVPAVVGIGSLPAFAAHSATADDDVQLMGSDAGVEWTEGYAEFNGATLVDPEEEITEPGLYELTDDGADATDVDEDAAER